MKRRAIAALFAFAFVMTGSAASAGTSTCFGLGILGGYSSATNCSYTTHTGFVADLCDVAFSMKQNLQTTGGSSIRVYYSNCSYTGTGITFLPEASTRAWCENRTGSSYYVRCRRSTP
jgi:hypothetical protein